MRASQTTRVARQARPLHTCPVGGWRQGGGIHTPIVATLPFFHHVHHKPTELQPKVDAAQIVKLAQAKDPHSDPAVARFRSEVQEQLAAVNTVSDAGNISQIVCQVAAKYFPQETPHTDKLARWQEPRIKQGIKDMWKAWRKYRSCNKDTTLKAAIGRWKTWTQYNRLYKKHKEHCRTAKKDYLLQQMNTAEQAAQNHNQRLLYQVVRALAPKAKRHRPQLRDSTGQMMTRSEEAACFHRHFTAKFAAAADALTQLETTTRLMHARQGEPCEGPTLQPEALARHLQHAPLRKAVPPGHPPSAIWRLCSDIIATRVCHVLDKNWTPQPNSVPRIWSDAHLVLIRKPAKTGKEEGHYRPIGLQDQLGKLTFKAPASPRNFPNTATCRTGLTAMPYAGCSITARTYVPSAAPITVLCTTDLRGRRLRP